MLELPADLAPGSTVVVAASGGADSTALADLLVADGRFTVVLWHLDHGLRADSLADAQAVEALARRLQVEAVIEHAAIAGIALAAGIGLEEAGRRERYRRLGEVCLRYSAVAACTAHHRDDQAETVLMQILRGCGPDGPPGIAPERGLPAGLRLLRPLLGRSRQELRTYCRTRTLSWREDPSNTDTAMRRNFLRHAVLADWEENLPGISEELVGLGLRSRLGRVAAERAAEAVPIIEDALPVAPALALGAAARGALWRRLLARCGVEADRDRLHRLDDLLEGAPGRRLRLGDWLLLRRGRTLTWQYRKWQDPRTTMARGS
jgi:tRNA(Ile)-lysidine synthase